jgi:hypothetical protein
VGFDRAKAAFKTCMHLSKAFGILDEVDACSHGMWRFDRIDGDQRIDEIFPRIDGVKRFEEVRAAPLFPAPLAAPR